MQDTPPDASRSKVIRWLVIAAGAGVVLLIALGLLLTRPLPPRTVVMATGAEGGAYGPIGQRYREIFARHGVRLELRATKGSLENVELLREPRSGVSVALVQSGVTSAAQAPELLSLGTLFYEPFWLFKHVEQEAHSKALRQGMRVSLGVPGSGSYKIARELVAAVGFDLSRVQVHDLSPLEAGDALVRGDLDFVGIAMAWDAPVVQRLLRHESIQPVDWPRADAHIALRPYLSKLILPRGVADLANDRPPRDLTLIAAKASLVVHRDLHPALQYLLLEAASEIHSAPGLFRKAGEFPAAEPIDLPLSEFAREYYRSGRPFLQRYLPFWLAALTARLLVLLIPVVGIAYPLFRLIPALYGWTMRRRIFRLYGELKFLEAGVGVAGASSGALSEQLDRLEERANRLHVPVAFAHLLYTLKVHISLVRQRVRSGQPGQPSA